MQNKLDSMPEIALEKTKSEIFIAPSVWISTTEFAELAGIKRAARSALLTCLNGGTWRGVNLSVRAIDGTGGQGGKSYQVYVPSLPENLRAIWYNLNKKTLTHSAVEPVRLPVPASINARIAAETAEWQWKLGLIYPALKHPKRSHARGMVIKDIARKQHVRPDGKTVTISLSTLRGWIERFEQDLDETTLVRKRRPKGLRRTIINRDWDKTALLPDTEKRRIAGEIETYCRSLWKEGAPSWHKVDKLATSKLLELSRAAGWTDANMEVCRLGRYYVERFESARKVAIKEKDAKRFADHFEPRIMRNLDGYKPMDIVIGDVHPVDILIQTEDGREITPRLIAWLDWVTGDMHTTLVFLGKREGIKQEHIARAFVAMVEDWGLPRLLYLDNGSEYKWDEMMDGFRALAGLAQAFDVVIASAEDIDIATGCDEPKSAQPPSDTVIRAKPYNAPAKAIEAVFGNLEQNYFSMIPGWIGGNRMNKRTHRVGKKPIPYPGNEQEFEQSFNQVMTFYRNTEQREKPSPNDRKRAFYADGWQPYIASYEVFLFAFSTIERSKVHTNGIQVNGEWYYADCLIPLIGSYIEVRAAKWDKSHLVWLDEQERPYLIPQAKTFAPTDRAGAVENYRRKRLMLQHVRDEKAGTVKLDMVEEIARHNAMHESLPPLPPGIEIGITPQVTALADARKNPPKSIETTLMTGSFQHKKTGAIFDIEAAPSKPDQDKIVDLDGLLLKPAKRKQIP